MKIMARTKTPESICIGKIDIPAGLFPRDEQNQAPVGEYIAYASAMVGDGVSFYLRRPGILPWAMSRLLGSKSMGLVTLRRGDFGRIGFKDLETLTDTIARLEQKPK